MFKLKHLKHISIITLILFALAAIAVAGPGFSGRSSSYSSSRSFSSGGSSWSKPSSSWSKPSSSSWSKPSAPSTSSWPFSSSKPNTSARSNYFSEVAKTTPKATIPAAKTYDTGYKPVKEVPTLPGKSYTTPSSTRVIEKHYHNNSSGSDTLNTVIAASVLSNALHNNRPQTVVVNNGTPVSAEAVPVAPQNPRVETVKEEGGMGFFGWIVTLGIIAGLFCYAVYRFASESHPHR